MADEPSLGEIARNLDGFRKDFAQFRREVLTVEVWKAEREALEFRLRETEKDIATLEAKHTAEREKRETEKAAADHRAAANRRNALFAVFTALIAPIVVAFVVAAFLKG